MCQFWPILGFLHIGETGRSLRERFTEHRSNIALKQGPTGNHFNLPGHSVADLGIIGIEKVYGNERVRLRREDKWINEYDSTKYGNNKKEL